MDRRKFITTGLAGLAAGSSLGFAAKAKGQKLVKTAEDLGERRELVQVLHDYIP